MAEKRLRMDLQKIYKNPPPGISASPVDDDIFQWNAIVCGPEGTPFEGGAFRLRLKFTPQYPNVAPTVWFYSRMFHPNVYSNGRICLDILEEPAKWNPDYDVAAILYGIQAMLGDPNPDSPANGNANNLFKQNMQEYEDQVKIIVVGSVANANDGDDGEMKNENELDYQEQERMEAMLNEMAIQDLVNQGGWG